jgi:hypothetical protein
MIKIYIKTLIIFIIILLFPAAISPFARPFSGLLLAQTTEQEDPFYKKLFEDGKYYYQNDKTPEAIENFEIAFFGYLDNLPKLLECYVYLTVCHFQQKNIEKSKYYADEIKRLKLQDYMKNITPPESLMKKYEEIIAKFYKS